MELTKNEQRALQIALEAHEGQKDKVDIPYVLHPIIVGLMGENEAERVVGFLHDVVEDTNVTFEDLEKEFDKEIIDALKLLTHDKKESYWTYIDRIANSSNAIAKAVKISDLTHNILRGLEARIDQSKHIKAYRALTGLYFNINP